MDFCSFILYFLDLIYFASPSSKLSFFLIPYRYYVYPKSFTHKKILKKEAQSIGNFMQTCLMLYYFLQAYEDIFASNFVITEKKECYRGGGRERKEGTDVKNIGNDCQWVKLFSSIRCQFGENIFSTGKDSIILEAE